MKFLAAIFITCLVSGSFGLFFGDDEGNSLNSFDGNSDVPLVKQNWANKLNSELNDRLNSSLVASYIYLSMSYHFDRADMSLPGFHKYFLEASHRSRDDAEAIMKYINKRGGYIKLKKIKNPPNSWRTGLKAMEAALGMEKEFNKYMLKTHEIADRDPHLTNFIEEKFLDRKVDFIKELGDHVTRLRSFRKDYHLGEYILDRDLRS